MSWSENCNFTDKYFGLGGLCINRTANFFFACKPLLPMVLLSWEGARGGGGGVSDPHQNDSNPDPWIRIQKLQIRIQVNLRANLVHSLQVKNFQFFLLFYSKKYLAEGPTIFSLDYIENRV